MKINYVICFVLKVTVENFIRVLTGRLPPSTPPSKRLMSDERSNILVYMTGIYICVFFEFPQAVFTISLCFIGHGEII